MEKPPYFPEEIWAGLTPEQKQGVAMSHTKTVKETRQRTQLSQLFQIRGSEACDAKKLLRAATNGTSAIHEAIDKLKELKETVKQRADTAQAATEACQSQLIETVHAYFADLSSTIKIVRWKQVAAIDEVIECLAKFHKLVANAEEVARATLLNKSFQSNAATIHTLQSRLAEGKVAWTLHCQRTECLTRNLSLKAQFDMDKMQVVKDAVSRVGTFVSGGLEIPLFTVGRQVTMKILSMAAPTNSNDWIERRRWAKMLVLVALKKTAGWETETGLCAVETVSMWWVKKYYSSKIVQEEGVTLPWTRAVAVKATTKATTKGTCSFLEHMSRQSSLTMRS